MKNSSIPSRRSVVVRDRVHPHPLSSSKKSSSNIYLGQTPMTTSESLSFTSTSKQKQQSSTRHSSNTNTNTNNSTSANNKTSTGSDPGSILEDTEILIPTSVLNSSSTTSYANTTSVGTSNSNSIEQSYIRLQLPSLSSIVTPNNPSSNSSSHDEERQKKQEDTLNEYLASHPLLFQRANEILSERVDCFDMPSPTSTPPLSFSGAAAATGAATATGADTTSNNSDQTSGRGRRVSSADDYDYHCFLNDDDIMSCTTLPKRQTFPPRDFHTNTTQTSTSSNSNSSSYPPVIYAHQREVVYASNQQYHQQGAILTTDAATTCHVLALRSTSTNGKHSESGEGNMNRDQTKILGSLCHLDSADYEACLEKIFETHVQFHHTSSNNDKVNINNMSPNPNSIRMEVHIVGGYNDSKQTSIEITHHLFTFLHKKALQYNSSSSSSCHPCRPTIQVILQTCVVSKLNDITSYTNHPTNSIDSLMKTIAATNPTSTAATNTSNNNFNNHNNSSSNLHRKRGVSISSSISSLSSFDTSASHHSMATTWSCHEYYTPPSPIVRGMALDVNSGCIQLLNKVSPCLWGPEPTLRNVRLWGCNDDYYGDDENDIQHDFSSLLKVHSHHQEQIIIQPFPFKPFHNMETLLKLPDDVMLQYTSTSPDVEAEEYCSLVREQFQFIMNVRVENVFGCKGDRIALVYDSDGNGWWDRYY
mmetsp:Transcript_8603/g.10864  ORF Transcript_8603/g.10864 Transcript_8603/m.10864 type:complete len:702 (+) Transcript_8603:142-2247(+)